MATDWYQSSNAFATAVSQPASMPQNPRTWADIAAWATGNRGAFGGSPAASCVFNNRLIYPRTGYTVGVTAPPINVFDGVFDHELCTLPNTTTGGVPRAILSMLAANGTVYFTTFDSGTDQYTWIGRVFQLDVESGVLTALPLLGALSTPAPDIAPDWTGQYSAGALTQPGYYGYAQCYVTAAGDTLIGPRAVTYLPNAGAATGILLQHLAIGPALVTGRKVFRTTAQATAGDAATAQLKLAVTIANNAAPTVVDGTADGALGVDAPTTSTLPGSLPYAMTWYQGQLWVGTTNGVGTAGKLYRIRPGIDTAWTTDYDFAATGNGAPVSLCSYNGKLYVGTDNAAGSSGVVLERDMTGAYTVSQLPQLPGWTTLNNGFASMVVFKGALYAAYFAVGTPNFSSIVQFNGSGWAGVYTGASGTLRPYIMLLVDNGTLFAIGGGMSLSGAIVKTTDGTNWTNCSAQLPDLTHTLLPIAGAEVL